MLMLGQRHRQWTNIKPELVDRLVCWGRDWGRRRWRRWLQRWRRRRRRVIGAINQWPCEGRPIETANKME